MPSTEQIARVCHEANRGWCEANGDFSQVPWDAVALWQRESALVGVMVALSGTTPQEQHQAWLEARIDDGWAWGKVKDPELKLHPCLVPYDALPPEQQPKDALFIAIVEALNF
jgi:hypothetical protein